MGRRVRRCWLVLLALTVLVDLATEQPLSAVLWLTPVGGAVRAAVRGAVGAQVEVKNEAGGGQPVVAALQAVPQKYYGGQALRYWHRVLEATARLQKAPPTKSETVSSIQFGTIAPRFMGPEVRAQIDIRPSGSLYTRKREQFDLSWTDGRWRIDRKDFRGFEPGYGP